MGESTTSSQVEVRQKLELAARWFDDIVLGIDLNIYNSFRELMRLRKAAAFHYLHTKDEVKQKQYFQLYEQINERIKILLGL